MARTKIRERKSVETSPKLGARSHGNKTNKLLECMNMGCSQTRLSGVALCSECIYKLKKEQAAHEKEVMAMRKPVK